MRWGSPAWTVGWGDPENFFMAPPGEVSIFREIPGGVMARFIDIEGRAGYTRLVVDGIAQNIARSPKKVGRTISAAVIAAGVMTVTTTTQHQFHVGQLVSIVLDDQDVYADVNFAAYSVQSTPSNLTFTVNVTHADVAAPGTTTGKTKLTPVVQLTGLFEPDVTKHVVTLTPQGGWGGKVFDVTGQQEAFLNERPNAFTVTITAKPKLQVYSPSGSTALSNLKLYRLKRGVNVSAVVGRPTWGKMIADVKAILTPTIQLPVVDAELIASFAILTVPDHGLVVGQEIVVSLSDPADAVFSGTFTVAIVMGDDQFAYVVAHADIPKIACDGLVTGNPILNGKYGVGIYDEKSTCLAFGIASGVSESIKLIPYWGSAVYGTVDLNYSADVEDIVIIARWAASYRVTYSSVAPVLDGGGGGVLDGGAGVVYGP